MTRKTTDPRCEEGSDRTDFVGMLRGAGLLLAGCAAAVLLFSVAGCSATDAGEPSIASTAEVLEENAPEKSVEYASFEEVAAAFDASALNLEYSKRDMDASFDESSATKITLSGDSASVSGSGAVAEGSTVTISTAGTYIVSGNLTDGSITVTTSENDKVQIVLNGVKIACSSGPAIDIQSADKCFITLAEGTQNSLSDGSAFASEDANACIYATCDLTINGSGLLDVSGNYRHGVFSKDDLVVYGGSINVSAVEDGLNGKDSVKIGAGDISIDSGADGVKSSKSTNPEKGFVYVSGGSLSIDAEDDGIQAKTHLCMAGGSIEIDAADDALHSDLEGALNGGLTSVRSGDDAFHCETKLEVNDGSFVAEACSEGYEAEQVVVNGGDTNICALDDAMNASAADLSDDSESSDADMSTSTPSGELGANAAQPDGSIGASSANADSNGQQNTAPQGAGQQDGATSLELPSDDGAQGGQAGEAPSDLGHAPDVQGRMERGGQAPGGQGGAPGVSDSNCLIQINGGTVALDSQGDGVDSNGNVEITGGTLLVNGPSSDGDGAFDYDGEATISGGTVLMAGAVGMAQSFTSGTQAFALVQASGSAGSVIEATDADGNVIATFTATRAFGCVLVSGAGVSDGDTITVSVDGAATMATAATTGTSGIATGGLGGMGGGSATGNRPEGQGSPT
ncbi:MAG: hypothetical protein DBX56_02895 [Coriobacteriia bacterium]|nr:MAG: hypothetical protein DBX56_02895 [Coriobacteriia bacterium]